MLATEIRRDGELVGVYFQAPDPTRLNGLAKIVSNALPDASDDYYSRSARAFSLLVAGPSQPAILREYGERSPTTLQENGEAGVRHENSGKPVVLLAVCRTKPANKALASHLRNGWELLGSYYTTDAGLEYAVLIRRLTSNREYRDPGVLAEVRLPQLDSAGPVNWADVVQEEERQRVEADKAKERQYPRVPDDERLLIYHDPRGLHKKVLFSPLSPGSSIHCWQHYTADLITAELIAFADEIANASGQRSPVERLPGGKTIVGLARAILPEPVTRLIEERRRRAARAELLLDMAVRAEDLADTAEHRHTRAHGAWLEPEHFVAKPREVARRLREAAAAPSRLPDKPADSAEAAA